MDAKTNLADFLREVAKGTENALGVSEQVLRDQDGKELGKHVRISMENRTLRGEPPTEPERAESPARAHIFHGVAGLVEYLAKYKGTDTVVFADAADGQMAAVLDERAERGVEVLTLKPQIDPLFAPWMDLLGAGEVPINDFAEFILKNRRAVCEPNGKVLALLFSQVRAAVNITLQKGRGRKAINGIVMQTEIQGETATDPVDLPDEIIIECPLFVDTPPRKIAIDLLVSVSKDDDGDPNLVVTATSSELAQARMDAFAEMVTTVRSLEGVVVAMGSPAHRPWAYLT
ncbi:MAG: hypothetical protein BWX88_05101 [Planctomycetes bacterium ADurb.Bin126]|nr:MAG: hypothetical protein BWX88_05101 [Planctomycetes bacterium ADurb.Bin126]